MDLELKKIVSYAERNDWKLDYFSKDSFIVSRPKLEDAQRKLSILKDLVNNKGFKIDVLPVDDFIIVNISKE